MTELTLAVRLTADGEDLIGAVRVSKEEIDKLGKAATSANKDGAEAADRHGRAVRGTREEIRQTSPVMAEMTNQVKRLVGAWLTFESVKAVISGMIREATQAEKISASLGAVLKATGQSAGYTREQLDALADSMARTTLFDDDTLRQGIAVMATFRSVQGDTFREAIGLSADLAALLGTDLQSAILMMGKALAEPTTGLTALTRAGVNFSANQKDVIRYLDETGRKAEAQKIILKELADQLGGAAAAQNQGLVKQVTDLTKAWNDFLEVLGRSGWVINLVEALAKAVRALAVVAGGPSGGDDWMKMTPEQRRRYLETGEKPTNIGAANAAPVPPELSDSQQSLLRQLAEQTSLIGRSSLEAEQMKALRQAGFRPAIDEGAVTVEDFEKLPAIFQSAVEKILKNVTDIWGEGVAQRVTGLQRGIGTTEALREGRRLGPDARAGIVGQANAANVAAEARINDPRIIDWLGQLYTAQEKANRELSLTEQLYDQLRGPQEQYAERLRVIQREHANGGITAEEMRRATRAATLDMLDASREWSDGVERGVIRVLDEAGDAAQGFEDLTVGAFKRSEDAFVQWNKTGKLAAGDLFDFIGEQLLRMAYRAAIVEPFLSPLEDAFKGWVKGLGGGSETALNPEQRMFGYEGHEGGQLGGPNAFRPRVVPSWVYEGAPRLHGGGVLGPDEIPFIGKKGEVVGWPSQMAQAFGGAVNLKVEVINQGGGALEETGREQARGPNGEQIMRIFVRDAVRQGMNQGDYDKQMGSNFGTQRVPSTRRS